MRLSQQRRQHTGVAGITFAEFSTVLLAPTRCAGVDVLDSAVQHGRAPARRCRLGYVIQVANSARKPRASGPLLSKLDERSRSDTASACSSFGGASRPGQRLERLQSATNTVCDWCRGSCGR